MSNAMRHLNNKVTSYTNIIIHNQSVQVAGVSVVLSALASPSIPASVYMNGLLRAWLLKVRGGPSSLESLSSIFGKE